MKTKLTFPLSVVCSFFLTGLCGLYASPRSSPNGGAKLQTVIEYVDGSDSPLTHLKYKDVKALLLELKRELHFTASTVQVEGNTLHFKSPRLKEKAISPYTQKCIEYKKNLFGYDVCQEFISFSIGNILCSDLELASPENKFNRTQSILTSSNYHTSIYRFDGEDYSYLRTSSMLVGRVRFEILETLTCRN